MDGRLHLRRLRLAAHLIVTAHTFVRENAPGSAGAIPLLQDISAGLCRALLLLLLPQVLLRAATVSSHATTTSAQSHVAASKAPAGGLDGVGVRAARSIAARAEPTRPVALPGGLRLRLRLREAASPALVKPSQREARAHATKSHAAAATAAQGHVAASKAPAGGLDGVGVRAARSIAARAEPTRPVALPGGLRLRLRLREAASPALVKPSQREARAPATKSHAAAAAAAQGPAAPAASAAPASSTRGSVASRMREMATRARASITISTRHRRGSHTGRSFHTKPPARTPALARPAEANPHPRRLPTRRRRLRHQRTPSANGAQHRG